MVIRLKTLSKIIICLIFLGCIVLLVKGGFDWYQKTAYPREYSQYVEKYAREYQVDEDLIYAVIKTESGFDPKAVSVNDAKGLMQITKDTFDWISGKLGYKDKQHDDLFDPETGIEYGTFFLSYLLNEFQEPEVALAAYHAGRGITNKWLQDPEYSPDGRVLEKIPYQDTAHYVKKAMKHYEIYQKQ